MELCIDKNFTLLTDISLTEIDGGTFWGVVGGVATVIAGGATVVAGVVLLAIPEPTTLTKYAGYGAIVTGCAAVTGGLATIANNL